MAGLSFENYSTNHAWGDRWFIWQSSITSNALSWGVLAFIQDQGRTGYIGGSYDAVKPIGKLIFIGQPVAVEPSLYTFTATGELVASQYGDDTYGKAPFLEFIDRPSLFSERSGYRYFDTGAGGIEWGSDAASYTFATQADFDAALDNHDIQPILPKVYFDIYINGSEKPSYGVNWTASEDLSPVKLAPRVWIGTQDVLPIDQEYAWNSEYEVNIPNTNAWNIQSAGTQNYDGSYSTTYLSVMQAFEYALNPVSKVEHWGFNGVPEYIKLYLRMDYLDSAGNIQLGTLHTCTLNIDGTYSSIVVPYSSHLANFDTEVRFHTGEPDYELPDDDTTYASGSNIDGDEDGRYNPEGLPDLPDFSETEGAGFDGNAVLTRTYAVSQQTLQNIGQKLWSQSYFDVLKIQTNPIENIIAVKAFPFGQTGTAQEIKVGDVAFGINGDKIPSVKKIHIGSVKYTGSANPSYLDLSPYTITKINLPYIGLVQLDASDLYNSTLDVSYVIDFVTGQCMAMLTLDGIPYINVYGNMGIDIPLTSTDRVQTELRAASAAISAVGGSAGQVISGNVGGGIISGTSAALSIAGAEYNSQRTSNQSPACDSYANHMVFLQIDTPLYKADPTPGYQHLHGYPCHKYMSLQAIYNAGTDAQKKRGVFVAVDRRTDIKVAMTAEENAMLERLLIEGVYVKGA